MDRQSLSISLVNKVDVMRLTGYSESQSKKLIREAKNRMVMKGFTWYANKRIGRVPLKIVEDILGFNLSGEHAIIEIVQGDTAIGKEFLSGSN